MSRAETLAQLEALLAKPGGKQTFAIRDQCHWRCISIRRWCRIRRRQLFGQSGRGQTSGKFFEWAKLADGEIARLSEAVARLLAEPSPSSMALLLGAVLGDGVASQLLRTGVKSR
jgi:hypothetical protein